MTNDHDSSPPSVPTEQYFFVRNISHLRNFGLGPQSKVAIIFLPGSQRRCVPGRDVLTPESDIRRYPREYRAMCEQTAIQILTSEHVPVPYSYFEGEPGAPSVRPPPVSQPQPQPPLDSAANDPNPQALLPSALDQLPPPAEFSMPLPTHPAAMDNPAFQEKDAKAEREKEELEKLEKELAALEEEESKKKASDSDPGKREPKKDKKK